MRTKSTWTRALNPTTKWGPESIVAICSTLILPRRMHRAVTVLLLAVALPATLPLKCYKTNYDYGDDTDTEAKLITCDSSAKTCTSSFRLSDYIENYGEGYNSVEQSCSYEPCKLCPIY